MGGVWYDLVLRLNVMLETKAKSLPRIDRATIVACKEALQHLQPIKHGSYRADQAAEVLIEAKQEALAAKCYAVDVYQSSRAICAIESCSAIAHMPAHTANNLKYMLAGITAYIPEVLPLARRLALIRAAWIEQQNLDLGLLSDNALELYLLADRPDRAASYEKKRKAGKLVNYKAGVTFTDAKGDALSLYPFLMKDVHSFRKEFGPKIPEIVRDDEIRKGVVSELKALLKRS